MDTLTRVLIVCVAALIGAVNLPLGIAVAGILIWQLQPLEHLA